MALSLSRQGVVFLAVFWAATRFAQYRGFLASQLLADAVSAVLALVLYRSAYGKGKNT